MGVWHGCWGGGNRGRRSLGKQIQEGQIDTIDRIMMVVVDAAAKRDEQGLSAVL